MRYESLYYFVTTANCKSMTLAGEVLHVAHQSISKEIRLLEDELGTTLFHRSSKGVSLTREGKIAYASAINCLKELNIFRNLFYQYTYNTFSVGYFAGLENHLNKALDVYTGLHPLTEFNRFSLSSHQIINELRHGNLDYILQMAESSQFFQLEKATKYNHFRLTQDNLMILTNKEYFDKDIFSLRCDLNSYSFSFFSASTTESTLFLNFAKRYGYTATNRHIGQLSKKHPKNTISFMTKTLLSGTDISYTNMQLLPIDEDIKIDYILSVKKSLCNEPHSQQLVKLISTIFTSN